MEGGVAAVAAAAAAAATVTTAVAPPTNGAAAPPPYLMKTYEMVDDPSTDGVVSWGEGNNSFVVWSTPEFARDLLPKYFKHSNFSSFVRQLNTYGFRKVDPDRWEFANEGFLRGQKHLLKTINRRKPLNANNQVQVQHQQQQQPQLQNGLCVEVGNFGMEEEIEMLKRDKNVLMQELVRLRQQQQTTDHQLETLGKRLQGMEQRQQQMMSFLAKAMQSPTFLAQFVQQNENSRRRIVAANKKRRLPKQDDGLMDSAESVSLDGQIIKYQPLINEAAKAMLRKILQQDSSSSHRFESMGGNADNFLLENNCMPTTPQAFDTSSSTGNSTTPQAFDTSSSTGNSAVTLAEVPGNSAGMQVPGNSAGMPYMATSSGLSAICSPSTPPEIQRPVFDNIPSNVLHNMSNNSSRVLPNMSAAAPSLPKAMTPGPSDISIAGFPDLHDLITDDPVNIPGGGGGFEMPGPECIFPLLPEDDDDSIPIDTDEILSSDDTQKLPGIIDSFWEQFLDEELYQLFCGPSGPQGDVEAIRVVRDPDTSLGKGIAYVLFKTREAANGVVRKRSLKIRDRLLRLTHAKAPDATPKKTDAGKTRGGPRQKTSFTPGSMSREGSDSNKRKEPASLSYQGLKSTKSGVVKKAKVIRRPSNQGKQQGSRPSETGQSESSRKSKRPAVAARKVKQLTKKRKLDGSTPENTHRSKKARK